MRRRDVISSKEEARKSGIRHQKWIRSMAVREAEERDRAGLRDAAARDEEERP